MAAARYRTVYELAYERTAAARLFITCGFAQPNDRPGSNVIKTDIPAITPHPLAAATALLIAPIPVVDLCLHDRRGVKLSPRLTRTPDISALVASVCSIVGSGSLRKQALKRCLIGLPHRRTVSDPSPHQLPPRPCVQGILRL